MADFNPDPATPADPTARLLARHAERRRQRLPTVSILVGSPAETSAAWRAAAGGRPVVRVPAAAATDPAALAAACLAGACRSAPLLTAAVVEVARRIGRPPGEVLAGKSGHDLDQLWRTVPTAGTAGDADVLTAVRLVCTGTADRWPADLSAALPGWRAVAAVDPLLADGNAWPPVWVAAPADDDGRWLAAAAGPLAALASAVPRWPVGVGTSSSAADAFAATAGSDRAGMVIAAGRVAVAAADGAPAPAVPPRSAERAARRAAADAARSEAERRLFQMLERAWPGRFRLNRPLGFRFGLRPAEADLLADDLRLVIEVDGYHHFAGGDVAWRRDRRKDWLYQVHGYRCRRVLAADVMSRPRAALDAVRVAVDDCERHPLGGGPTGTP